MSKIAILTDSASNLKEDIHAGIFVVPLYVLIQDLSKKDLEEITPDQLFSDLEDKNPTTSAPSVQDFLEKIAYIKSLGYESILGIAISSKMSVTMGNMKLALDEAKIPHHIVDSHNVSLSEGFLVLYAQHLLEEGRDLSYVGAKLESVKENARIYAVVGDLKYLIRGGRLTSLKGILGNILNIQPILGTNVEGSIHVYDSVRGGNRALKKMCHQVEKDLKGVDTYYLGILYSKEAKETLAMEENLKDLIQAATIFHKTNLTAVLGAQAGPSVQGIAYFKLP